MNFFEDQIRAKKESRKLLLAFIAVTFLVALATAFAFIIIVQIDQEGLASLSKTPLRELFDGKTFFVVFIIVSLFIFLISLIKISSFGPDGASVASSIGAIELTSFTKDPDEKKYTNIVEEMSIASGIPMPRVFLLKGNESINAFAAGTAIKNAAVCVTIGALRKLNRSELQGVIAHEFSHIFNGDMILNMRLAGIVGGLSAISDVGELFLRSSRRGVSSGRRSKDGGGGVVLLGLAFYIIGIFGSLMASLLKSAFSRQREFLADATSVQYTRNPEGIGGALKKIYADSSSLKIGQDRLHEISHMAFAETGHSFFSLATHPKLETRLERIYSRPFYKILDANQEQNLASELTQIEQKMYQHFEAIPALNQTMFPEASSMVLQKMVENQVLSKDKIRLGAVIDAQGILYANILRKKLHVDLDWALDQEKNICLLLYALVLTPSMNQDDLKSLPILGELIDEELKLLKILMKKVREMPEEYFLPLLEILAGKIKSSDVALKQKMSSNLHSLIRHDQKLNFREFLIWNYLKDILAGSPKRKLSLKGLSEERFKSALNYLFFFLSWFERPSSEGQEIKSLYDIFVRKNLISRDYLHKEQLRFSELEKKLNELKDSNLRQKEQALNLMSEIVKLDKRVSVREYEICRLVAHLLGIPVAPVIPDKLSASF